MTCPWLKMENGDSFCTAVDPPMELDFDNPGDPGVNGEICKFPAPGLTPSEPWSMCNRYRSK